MFRLGKILGYFTLYGSNQETQRDNVGDEFGPCILLDPWLSSQLKNTPLAVSGMIKMQLETPSPAECSFLNRVLIYIVYHLIKHNITQYNIIWYTIISYIFGTLY